MTYRIERTSKSAPANVASCNTQFCIEAPFKFASRKLIPVIWLPSNIAHFKLAPKGMHQICIYEMHEHSYEQSYNNTYLFTITARFRRLHA